MAKWSAQEKKTKTAYNAEKEQKDKRVIYNRNRRRAKRKGIVKTGDGKQLHHVKMLAKGGRDDPSNVKVVSEKENKGWRGKPGNRGVHPHDKKGAKRRVKRRQRRQRRQRK